MIWEKLTGYFEAGGPIMYALAGICLFLWYTIGFRIYLLGAYESSRHEDLPPVKSFSTAAAAAVGVAPLLGLLGTVAGMIGLFDTLASGQVNTDLTSSVAAGISTALFTTQFGLVIAIPGMFINRILARRIDNLVAHGENGMESR